MTESTLMIRTLSPLLVSISTAVLFTSANADTTLRMAHLWPASSTVNQEIYQAWAQQVEQESNGQLKVEVYPSQTLSKADKAYEAAVNGIADIAITVQLPAASLSPKSCNFLAYRLAHRKGPAFYRHSMMKVI